jgi:DNA-binding LacI/PurR family transcriptional regulator
MISDIQNPYFISVVRAVEDTAYARRMSVVLCNTDEDPAKQQMYLRVMKAEGVAGLIISPTHVDDGATLRAFGQTRIPIVLLDRQVDNASFDAVVVDNVRGAYTAVEHLIRLGHRRVAIIGGSPHLTTGRERLQGYCDALRAAGLPIEDRLVRIGDFKIESGYALARELTALSQPPHAIFVANNLMTLGALRALRELRVRIPDEIALVGFDDMPWSGELYPPLTAVSQPTYELGREAVTLLLNRLAEPHAPFRTVILQTHLIVRESCGALLQRNPGEGSAL